MSLYYLLRTKRITDCPLVYFDPPASLCSDNNNYTFSSSIHWGIIQFAVKMEKRTRPPQGYYKSLETASISCERMLCDRKPEVLGIYQAERIVAKKIHRGKPLFMVQWQSFCPSENTWEPKAHLPSELIAAFENPDLDPYGLKKPEKRSASCLSVE